MEILLAAGAAVDASNHLCKGSSLLAAIYRKDAHLAQNLLAAGAVVNREMSCLFGRGECTATVLPAAVALGYEPLIQEIIWAGAEVNSPELDGNETALTVAVENRDGVSIQLLIDAGADVNASAATFSGRTALEAAVRNNDIDMVHYLLGIGADSDEASLIAAVSTSMELMQVLLAARLRRYQRYSKGYGCGALQYAIMLKKAAMVEFLLASGIDTNAILCHKLDNTAASFDRNGSTIFYGESALGTAIKIDKANDLSIVRMLCEAVQIPTAS